ncbi:unnamed protein product [marine sediment metagenome]|uniref:Uncharacterized protein n=1 Tax=marine sediment metagenome TaxID=412755 RepID=X0YEA4_9ZZZZ
MSRKLFGDWYYSMENSYATKAQAQKDAKECRRGGRYHVRVAKSGFTGEPWAVFVRRK